MGIILGNLIDKEERIATWLAMQGSKKYINRLKETKDNKYIINLKGEEQVYNILLKEYLGSK